MKDLFLFLLSFKITLKSHWGFLSSARERKKNFKKSFWFRVGLLIFLIRSFYQAAPGIKSRKIYFNSASTKTYPPLLLTKPCCMCRTCSLVLERKELMKKGKFQDYRDWKWNICFVISLTNADKFSKRTKLNLRTKMVWWLFWNWFGMFTRELNLKRAIWDFDFLKLAIMAHCREFEWDLWVMRSEIVEELPLKCIYAINIWFETNVSGAFFSNASVEVFKTLL